MLRRSCFAFLQILMLEDKEDSLFKFSVSTCVYKFKFSVSTCVYKFKFSVSTCVYKFKFSVSTCVYKFKFSVSTCVYKFKFSISTCVYKFKFSLSTCVYKFKFSVSTCVYYKPLFMPLERSQYHVDVFKKACFKLSLYLFVIKTTINVCHHNHVLKIPVKNGHQRLGL